MDSYRQKKEKNLNLNLFYTKINSKRIINPNVKKKKKNYQSLRGKTRRKGIRQRVFRHDTKAQFIKEKLSKMDFSKIMNYCSKTFTFDLLRG